MNIQKIRPNKLSALLVILLIASVLTPLATVAAANGNGSEQGQQTQNGNSNAATLTMTQNQSQITNMNSNQTGEVNATRLTERQQIQARQQTQLQIRNTTMMMNCTNNCDVILSTDQDFAQDFQLSVDANQTMKIEMSLSRNPLNGAMVNERTLNFYLGIEPNATIQLQAQIRLRINQTELSQNLNREVNASRLTWMYWNQTTTQWEKVQSHMDQNGYLVCNTDHFSTWTVAEVANQEPTTPSTPIRSVPVEYFVVAAVAVIVVVVVGVIAYKKGK